jgi:hypothetical protein
MRALALTCSTGVLALTLLAPERASAFCTYPNQLSHPPITNVFALAANNCTVPAGASYVPTSHLPPGIVLPVPYTGFGFFADQGGVINSAGDGVSINTTQTGFANAYGVWSDGLSFGPSPTASQINLTGEITVTTSGESAYGLYATGGGVVTSSSASSSISTSGANASGVVAASGGQATVTGGTVTTSGANANGLFVTGGQSSIAASGVTIVTGAGGPAAPGGVGVLASSGGTATVSGGSVTTKGANAAGLYATGAGSTVTTTLLSGVGAAVVTSGNNSPGAQADNGGSVSLTSGSVATSGASSPGLYALGAIGDSGAASSISATGVTVSTVSSPGLYASGAGATISTSAGSTVATTGAGAPGVLADNGGAVSLGGGSVKASGLNSPGVSVSGSGSTVTATNVAVTTQGASQAGGNAAGLLVTSSGTVNFSGGSIATNGASAAGADALGSGSQVTLNGGAAVLTSNAGGAGLVVSAGASLNGTGIAVTTHGGVDASDGLAAFGAYNGPWFNATAGGALTLTDSSITTTGAGATGVYTTAGGTTTLSGTKVATAGPGAVGVATFGGGVANIGGSSVTTTGLNAHALVASGAGSQTNLTGTNLFTTQGAGAIGLYANAGGLISATGATTVATSGSVSSATGLAANGINADGSGSKITLGATGVSVSGAGAFGLLASDATASGAAGSIAASGALNVTTANAAAAAIGLQGNGASILATAGGTIVSAGDSIVFLGGANQTATFDNFSIANQTGDLVFADPSVATINFNSTTANAGGGNLLDATNGSIVTLNANASTLTGAIQTDAASTSIVNLLNHSTWTMTGSSAVSNLAVTNSVVVFAPPGSGAGFKTLTVQNYVGSGALMTMNAALGGTGSASDQLIINGGKATGATLLTIHNVGGAGGLTIAGGIPLIIATNGGTIAPNAFALANNPVVGGYQYSLEQTGQNYYLVSVPTTTQGEIANSITNVVKAQQQQIITGRVLTSILLGATEQVSCSNCSSGFGSFGSFALGAHGRYSLSDELTLMGGFSYDQYAASGISVTNAPTFAGALVYDPVNFGRSRPFLEIGGGVVPYEQVRTSRSYPYGSLVAEATGNGIDRSLGLFGRVGWVDRITPVDEAAVYTDISRSWLSAGGYTEVSSLSNPFPATVQNGIEALNVARVGGQYTHLLGGRFELNGSFAVAYGFDATSGSQWDVLNFGTVPPYSIGNSVWYEWGARVGYRFSQRMVIDAFVLGTLGGQIGTTFHGGLGLRYLF